MPPRSKIPCTPRGTTLRPLVSTPPCMLRKIPHTSETEAPPRKIPRLPRTPPPSPQPRSPAEKIPESRAEISMFQGSSSIAAPQACQQAGVGPAIPESTPGSAGGTSSGTARTEDTRCEEMPQEAIEDIQAEDTCTASPSHNWKAGWRCNKCDGWTRAKDAMLFGSFDEENGMFICTKCLPTPHLDRCTHRKKGERTI